MKNKNGVRAISFFKKYEYVLAVSEHGGISQAAEELGVAQPTLSKFIKKLESDLGTELFDRTTVPITLTAAGELFLESGKRVLYVEKQFQKELHEMTSGKNAVIRIGISPSRSPYMMPDIIEAYRARHPECRVVIEERTTAELNNRLTSGDLDLTISLYSADTQDFMCTPLFEENLMLAVPKTFDVSQSTAIDVLSSVPLINVGKGQAIWQTVNAITDAIGIKRPDIECQSIESGVALVRRGLGCMIVPSYISDFGSSYQNESISFIAFSKEEQEAWKVPIERKVCLFYRKEQFLSASEKDFIDCVKSVINKK